MSGPNADADRLASRVRINVPYVLVGVAVGLIGPHDWRSILATVLLAIALHLISTEAR